MEYLSRVFKSMGSLPDFKMHPMSKKLKLTHLIFADDLMVFCKGEVGSVKREVEALTHFSRVSGLVANMDKSSLFMVRIIEEEKQELLNITGFSEGSFPIRYLGLPLSPKK